MDTSDIAGDQAQSGPQDDPNIGADASPAEDAPANTEASDSTDAAGQADTGAPDTGTPDTPGTDTPDTATQQNPAANSGDTNASAGWSNTPAALQSAASDFVRQTAADLLAWYNRDQVASRVEALRQSDPGSPAYFVTLADYFDTLPEVTAAFPKEFELRFATERYRDSSIASLVGGAIANGVQNTPEPAANPSQGSPTPGSVYKMQPGNSLWWISQQTGIPLDALEAANPQVTDVHKIPIGAPIVIPAAAGENGSALQQASAANPSPDDPTPGSVYKMQKGDTLWALSQQTGIPLDDIEAANPQVTDVRKIPIGAEINIPNAARANGSAPFNNAAAASGAAAAPANRPNSPSIDGIIANALRAIIAAGNAAVPRQGGASDSSGAGQAQNANPAGFPASVSTTPPQIAGANRSGINASQPAPGPAARLTPDRHSLLAPLLATALRAAAAGNAAQPQQRAAASPVHGVPYQTQPGRLHGTSPGTRIPQHWQPHYIPEGNVDAGAQPAKNPAVPQRQDSAMEAIVRYAQQSLRLSMYAARELEGGIVEPILRLFTSALAKPASDVAGLGALMYEMVNGGVNAEELRRFIQYVQGAWTYQPTTALGNSAVNPLNSIPAWFAMLLNFALPAPAEDGSTPEGMARNGLREAILQLLNLLGVKYGVLPKALREGDLPPPGGKAATLPEKPVSAPGHNAGSAPTVREDVAQSFRNIRRTGTANLSLKRDAAEATRLYNKLVKINQLATHASDPAQLAQALSHITALHPAKGFYLNARALLGELRETPKKAKANAALLNNLPSVAPDLAKALPDAILHNRDVYVPFDFFAEHLAGKVDGLLQYAKPTPGKPGYDEAQALLKGGPNPAENLGNTGAKSWGNTHPPLPPEQVKVPGGGLRAQEAIGGHTLERHVGWTKDELVDRYKKEPNIPAASSFYNEGVAEDAIAAALKAKEAEIKAWVVSGYKGKVPTIHIEMSYDVGITVPKGSTIAHNTRGVTVGIRKDPLAPDGYYIITGFPE